MYDDHDYGGNDAGKHLASRSESQRLFLDFIGVDRDAHRRNRQGVGVFQQRVCACACASVCVCVGVGVRVRVCVCARARGGCERVDIHERAVCLHDCTCAAAITSAHKHNTAGDRLMHTAC